MALARVDHTPPNPVKPPTGDVPNTILRDQYKRPFIVTPDGSVEAYTRASSIGGVLEDQSGLGYWRMRQAIWAIGHSRALRMRAAAIPDTASSQSKEELRKLGFDALDFADSHAMADVGTALHALTERVDKGLPIPDLDEEQAAIEAYIDVVSGRFAFHAAEQFVVCDEFGVAGTFDRLVEPLVDLPVTDAKGKPYLHPDGTPVIIRAGSGTRLVWDLKGLSLDTPLPTPTGWTTMGAVQAGDQVFGSDGRPCRVTAKSSVKRIGTYIVEFDTGEQVVCDREHLWWVLTGRGERDGLREQVLDVETLRDTLFRYGQRQHRVPVSAPLDLPPAELPIDPYLLGCWLGDGNLTAGKITKDPELFDLLAQDGHRVGKPQHNHSDKVVTCTIFGLTAALREVGILGHRVIPDIYLRASIEQRQALLRGLMDSDGTWNVARNRAVFSTTVKALASQVSELCLSLGLKPRQNEIATHGFGKDVTAHTVEFRPLGFNPFRLARKADQVQGLSGKAKTRTRIVRSVTPGPDVETACIAVDSPNRTYLCGQGMIPTHNTSGSSRYFGIKFAAQCAAYANGVPYRGWHTLGEDVDPKDVTQSERKAATRGERLDWPDGIAPSTDWALILHVPSSGPERPGDPPAQLFWVDLRLGRQVLELACQVQRWRSRKDLVFPAQLPKLPAVEEAERRIKAATTLHELETIWREHRHVWNSPLTALAGRRKLEIAS